MADFRFSEADADFDPDKLSPEQRKAWEAAKATAASLDQDTKKIMEGAQVRAGFKIEIFFGPKRSVHNDYGALVTVYESGKHFHGGGDSLAYYCLDQKVLPKGPIISRDDSAFPLLRALLTGKKEVGTIGCGHIIPSDNIVLGRALCLHCKKEIYSTELVANAPFFGATADLAEFCELLFVHLKHNADIYCKYDRTDIRYQVCETKYGAEKAHYLRGLSIYPLHNILRDTSNGSSLVSRFKSFLNW